MKVEHVGKQLSANGAVESPSTGSWQECVSAVNSILSTKLFGTVGWTPYGLVLYREVC